MKNHESIQRKPGNRPFASSALSLAAAITFGLYGAGAWAPAHAQATTGSIFGQVPANSGETVTVSNSSGITRQVAVDSSGRYTVGSLPLGDYTVTLQHDGQTVDTRAHVTLRVGAGTEVSFGAANAANAQTLTAVTVQANALPTIDVTGVDSRTVITSQQLARLPLARSAEAIALLAPGVVEGSGLFMGLSTTGGSVVSFGGSSVVENAYYINGFNSTDPLSGFGGLTLPYGAIDQQEILSGGYGAAYGRSDGGVISQ
ncbi:MAG: carboxypeptidase-like regulatory domain-containing protein, partial [Rhodanobacter sp.]